MQRSRRPKAWRHRARTSYFHGAYCCPTVLARGERATTSATAALRYCTHALWCSSSAASDPLPASWPLQKDRPAAT